MSAVGTASSARPVPTSRRHDSARRAQVDAVVRVLAGSALWLALLLVAYWWAAGAGVQDLGSWASGLVSVGRLSGLVASVLLLAQVVLMARVPVLEAAFGQDRLAHTHRLVGFTSFNLMVLHIVTITWGYAAGSLLRAPATLWNLTWQSPGVLLSVGGAVCLFLVVGTSIRAARRKLRYESWHLLHLYAYLGVGLALPHQLWTGTELKSSPGRTVFWWTAWALTAATVLAFRVGVPVWVNLSHRLRVAAVVPEAGGIASVHLTGRRLDRLGAEAGQFLSWRFLTGPGWTRTHPYSLSAAPDGRSLRITVQAVGDGSAEALRLRPGTRALIEGPYGRLSARARTRPRVALIGAGVGITPLRALAEGLDYAPGDAVLLQRFTDEPLFAAELTALAEERGLQAMGIPGRRRTEGSWLGDGIGPVSDLDALRWWIPDIAERDVFVCGPERWTELVRTTLATAGVPAEQLHLETFSW